MAITVYRYGMPARVQLPSVVDEQLFLAHQLREDLVTIHHEYEEAVQQTWSSYPQVEKVEASLVTAEERVRKAVEKVAELREQQRTRFPQGLAVADLREARAAAKEARQARRAAIAAVRKVAKPRLDRLTTERKVQEKALYAKYVQGNGLYWAVYNDVAAHHGTAVRGVQAKRRQGRPARLRHHHWDGSGALAVQLQRVAADPPRSPPLLASGQGRWRNVLQVSPWRATDKQVRGSARHGIVKMRVGSELIELPLYVHRYLPLDADITGARLVVRRVAGHREVYLTVTAKVPDSEPVTDGPMIALHCGWRRETDDAIRAATWRSSAPVTVPTSIRDVVQPTSAKTGLVVLPAPWRRGLSRYDRISAARDARLNEIRDGLVTWLTEHPLDGEGAPTAAEVARWRSPKRFARLAMAWRDNPPSGGETIAAWLEGWRAADRVEWERSERGRAKALRRRDDAWRRVAAWIADTARVLVVDDSDLADLSRRVAQEEKSVPTEVTRIAAGQRIDAASGGLRSAAKKAAVRDGVAVITVPAAGLSAECYRCGDDMGTLTGHEATCGACGYQIDSDAAAVLHMLRRASKESATLSLGTP